MTGRLTIKDSKYYAVINLPAIDKKYKQKWIQIGNIKDYSNAKAQKELRTILNEYELKYANYYSITPDKKEQMNILFVDWVQ